MDLVYLTDTISMLIYKNVSWDEVAHLYKTRSTILLVMDLISLIPVDFIYFNSSEPMYIKVVYVLRLRYCFRINRLILELIDHRDLVGMNNFYLTLIEFLLTLGIVIFVSSSVIYLVFCSLSPCGTETKTFMKFLYIACGTITGTGYITKGGSLVIFWLITILNISLYLYIRGFINSKFTVALKQEITPWALFSNRLREIVERMNDLFRRDELIKMAFLNYYTFFWRRRGGLKEVDVEGILPEILATEIGLDLSWHALKHSHLFRNEDVHFLHYVSTFVQHSFMMAGETIFKRNQTKSKMVYVVTGIIQIFSEEDGETPILSLSGGTCIGESSLIISYPSSCTVVCQTYCELDILERSDFVKIKAKYPEHYHKLREQIHVRYEEAREYAKVLDYQTAKVMGRKKSEVSTMKFIKVTLRRLMSKDDNYMEHYMRQLTVEDRIMVESYNKLMFCPTYLDMLVLTDEVELVTDSIFLSTSCPCILQPDSVMTRAWEMIVLTVLLVTIFVYPYYVVFTDSTDSEMYLFFIYFVTGIWWMDIYVQLSTAIKTSNEIITDMSEIALKRSSDLLFVLDILAAIPIEMIADLVTGSLAKELMQWLQINRLFKIRRIEYLLKGYEQQITHDIVLLRYLRYSIYIIIWIYFIAALHFLLMEAQNNEDPNVIYEILKNFSVKNTFDVVLICLYLSTNLLTGLGSYLSAIESSPYFYPSMIVVHIVTIVFQIVFMASVSAAEAMKGYRKLTVQEHLKNVNFIMNELDFSEEISETLREFTLHQWFSNKGKAITYPYTVLFDAPKDLFYIIRHNSLKHVLENVPLFRDISKEMEVRLCAACSTVSIPPGQIMTYARGISNEMYIVWNGYCDVMSADGRVAKVIGPGESFAVIETCMKIPIVNSVVTRTCCVMLSLSYNRFREAVSIDPSWWSELKEIINTSTGWSHLEDTTERDNQDEVAIRKQKPPDRSFVNFGYRINPDSKEGKNYHDPFNELGYWGFVRHLLLRNTFTSYGTFIHCWECFRCIFAFLSVVLFSLPFLSTCDNYFRHSCTISFVMLFLDLTAWIDIYVRHHACYFNENGIEITHPLKTAINYWKHGFAVDVAGSLPIYMFIDAIHGHISNGHVKAYLKLNRILQMYRFLKAFEYKNNDIASNARIWTPLMFLLILFVAINYLSSFVLYFSCDFGEHLSATENFEEGVYCDDGCWLSTSFFRKPISPVRAYLYGLYFVTTIITSTGLQGFVVHNVVEATIVTFVAFLGFMLFTYMTAKIISVNLSRNVDLTNFQEGTRALMNFLRQKRIDDKLRNELIEHFEYFWRKLKGRRYGTYFYYCNNALKEDLMFNIFGRTMQQSTIFANASTSFFRSLLLRATHRIIIRRGVISRVNDVHGKIFFLFKGQVEVLGPDYNRLLILPVGSMFGNLDEIPYGRHTLTMVAKGHVEVLEISTTDFYEVLNSYARLRTEFRKLTAINVDYLVGGPLPPISRVIEPVEIAQRDQGRTKRKLNMTLKNFFVGVHNRSTGIKVWELTTLVLTCFCGFNLELYRVAVRDTSFAILSVLYFFDFLYTIKIYLKFHTGYDDEFGILVVDKRLVAKHYLKAPFGFWIDFVSVIPLEVIALMFYSQEYIFSVLWMYCRCNRFIRVFFVIEYFQTMNKKVNVNVYTIRTLHLIFWIILILQTVAAALLFLSCVDPINNVYPKMECDLESLSSKDKLMLFLRELSMIISIFTGTLAMAYYPNSPLLIILVSILMFLSRFLVAHFMAETCATFEVVVHNKTTYEKRINEFKTCMTMQRLSPVIVERAWRYLCLLWTKQRGFQFPKLLETAPYYLQEAVLNSMFGYHIRTHPVLKVCHVDLVRQMAATMRTRIFFPGDYITFMGDIDESMYFLHVGQVKALSEDTVRGEVVNHVLNSGDMFGLEQGLFPRIGQKFTYKATRYTVIVVLERKKWIHLLDFFPASKVLIFQECTVR